MVEVTKNELEKVLKIFQNDKILSLDGVPIKLYLSCFEFIGYDLLRVIEYSKINGKILAPLKSTFLALIPKTNNPSSFDHFEPFPYAK